jgi:hypothetical protein
LFLVSRFSKGADFLVRRYEKLVQVISNYCVRQCVLPERLRVISRELRIFEIARKVQNKQ